LKIDKEDSELITRKLLKQIESIRKEIREIRERKKRLELKPVKVVKDSVQSSSSQFPYTRFTAKIEGYENPRNLRKYKKQLQNADFKLGKLINQLEYELNKVEDSELRRIIRYRYEDGLNWIQIQFKMEYNTEDTARKKLDRFLEKN
jgi:valyl-tRNA synthetase